MSQKRVVFMGTPAFAVPSLEAIANSDHQVVGVYTQPDRPKGRGLEMILSPVKQLALKLGYPVFQPEKLVGEEEINQLQSLQPDVIVVVAFGQILRKPVLEIPPLGCINVHASLLPRWRGASPIHHCILAGDHESGITTMKLVSKLDAGDMLLQSKVTLDERETTQSLHDKLCAMGGSLIVETLDRLEDIQPIVQDETLVTFAPKLTKEMQWLEPQLSAIEMERKVRALNPWPGTRIQLGDRSLKVKEAQAHPDLEAPNDSLVEKNGMLLLGTPQGALQILRLQWDGKKEMDVSEFLNGLQGQGVSLPLRLTSG